MVGAVGADADGAWMRDELGHAGVDTADLRTVAAPTGTALIVVGADAENQIAVCPGANELVSLEGVAVGPDEAVLLQLEIAMSVVESVVARAEGFVAVNAAPAQPLPDALLQRVDLFIVNETERELMPELADAALVAVTYGAAGLPCSAAARRSHGRTACPPAPSTPWGRETPSAPRSCSPCRADCRRSRPCRRPARWALPPSRTSPRSLPSTRSRATSPRRSGARRRRSVQDAAPAPRSAQRRSLGGTKSAVRDQSASSPAGTSTVA